MADQESIRATFETCKQDVARLESFSSIKPSPILAVCGLLNSGKSSLVAGFLSRKGRDRVLVGLGDEAGTHRFVVWLPESWRKSATLWDAAIKQIEQVFGHPAQMLSEDRAIARKQYNGQLDDKSENDISTGDSFSRPLIATDPLLDELGIGLMDCPDIQSGIFGNDQQINNADFRSFQDVADQRARILMNGLRIASGLIVVAQSNLIRERTLEQLLEVAHAEMPHTRLFVAVNRVPKRYEPEQIKLEVSRHYLRFHPHGVYMAYDFRGPDSDAQIPPPPNQWAGSDQNQLPIFFDIESRKSAESNYLVSIGARLDNSKLAQDLLRSTIERLITNLKTSQRKIESEIAASQKRLSRLHQSFSEAILQFAAVQGEGSNVRLQLSQEIIDQVRQSLERTAPWWAKPSQAIGRWSTNLTSSAKGLTNKIPGLPSLGKRLNESVEWIRGKIRSGQSGSVMTASQLATSLRRCDKYGDLPVATSEGCDTVVATAGNIIVRFQKESHAKLNDAALDQGTALLWKQMPLKQKLMTGVAPATLIFAPLIAVVTIPIDFGTTHVLVFATVKELMLAGVASAGIFLLQSDQFPELAESQAAWQQVSDLFAITCDEFGCPRPSGNHLPNVQLGNERKTILSSATKMTATTASHLPPMLQFQQGFEQRFQTLLGVLAQQQKDLLSRI